MIIKVLLIAAAIGVGILMLRERVPGQRLALRRAAGIGTVLVGIIAVLWPEITTTVANAIGVGRGTDLVLYLFVMAFAYAAVAMSQRIHRLERAVTVLTRELALARPLPPSGAPSSSSIPVSTGATEPGDLSR